MKKKPPSENSATNPEGSVFLQSVGLGEKEEFSSVHLFSAHSFSQTCTSYKARARTRTSYHIKWREKERERKKKDDVCHTLQNTLNQIEWAFPFVRPSVFLGTRADQPEEGPSSSAAEPRTPSPTGEGYRKTKSRANEKKIKRGKKSTTVQISPQKESSPLTERPTSTKLNKRVYKLSTPGLSVCREINREGGFGGRREGGIGLFH